MSDYPRISEQATRLIDAVLRANEEDFAGAIHALHHYIESLEKRKGKRQ